MKHLIFRTAGILFVFAVCTRAYSNPERDTLPEHEAWVGEYLGRNVFFVNGKPVMPLMYSGTEQGRATWQNPSKENIAAFIRQGYSIVQTDMWFKYSLQPDGSFDVEGIRKQLASILEINPTAYLVLRINVSAPQWWLDRFPDARCKTTKAGPDNHHFSGNTAESLASDHYTAFAHQYLRLFLIELLRLPESGNIIGIHIGGGVYGEWHYYGIFNEPDASRPMQEKFGHFAMQKYGSLEHINQAWKTRFNNAGIITVPSFERRYQASDGEFYDPVFDMQVIDYYECQQQIISGLVNSLAKLVKNTWPRRVLTGVFFGYFYGGFTVGAQASQADIQTIFKSPYIDYFAGPYFSRSMYGSGCFRSLAESAYLNGKIWLTEHDGGTHLGSSGSGLGKFPDIPADEQQTIARMKRNFMYTITERGGQWWYDFGPRSQGGGWWNTPALLNEAGKLRRLAEQLMETPFEKHADVLVVHSMSAYYYHRPKRSENLTNLMNDKMADALLGTGVSFDKIFLMDLTRVNLRKYKLIIFANTVILSDMERQFIKDRVIKDGRTVIFLGAAGYTNSHKNSDSLLSDVVGITVKKITTNSPILNLSLHDGHYNISAPGVINAFKVTDPQATPIGFYENGDTGAAVKYIQKSRVYYFGIPLGADASPFKALFKASGVRFFVENTVDRDYVSIGGGIIAIYSVNGGTKTLYPLDGSTKQIHIAPFTTTYYRVTDGEPLQ